MLVVNDKHKQILKLLWDFQSLRSEHILKICNCTEKDINYLIGNNAISREKNTQLLKYNGKPVNNRNVVAFDVVMQYLDKKPKLKKAKYPINVTMQTDEYTYDIIAIKEAEVDTLFEDIDEISTSDRVIIIIETKQYVKKNINTKKPCYICTYPPIEIVDRIN